MRTYLAQQAGVNPDREFYLLETLGRDLPGALVITPIANQMAMDLAVEPKPSEGDDSLFHFSLAGVQLKFSALEAPQGGLTIPAKGVGGQWILKLPSTRWQGVPENEYSMMMLAKKMGLAVPDIQLVPVKVISGLPNELAHSSGGEPMALAVKRFDRGVNGEPIHMEDMAQVFGLYPHDKYKKVSYDNIAQLLWQTTDEDSLIRFIQLLVFNLAIGNGDAHLKNWSLVYPDKISPKLSPAYDLVATLPYISEPTMALSLGGTKDMHAVDMDTFKTMAKKAKLPTRLVEKTVNEAVAGFREVSVKYMDELPASPQVVSVINNHIKQLSLFSKNPV